MWLRPTIILSISFLINCQTLAQQFRFFKDFNLHNVRGVDAIDDTSALPNFYIECEYDNKNKLIEIISVSKFTWSNSKHHYSVIENKDSTVLFVARIIQNGRWENDTAKNDFIADSVLLANDTLIYKSVFNSNISIQLFTNIVSDSIQFEQMSFTFLDSMEIEKSTLSSLNYYKSWFTRTEIPCEILSGVIKLKSDPIVIWKTIRANNYRNVVNITKKYSYSNMPSMPVSLFWLHDSGLLQ